MCVCDSAHICNESMDECACVVDTCVTSLLAKGISRTHSTRRESKKDPYVDANSRPRPHREFRFQQRPRRGSHRVRIGQGPHVPRSWSRASRLERPKHIVPCQRPRASNEKCQRSPLLLLLQALAAASSCSVVPGVRSRTSSRPRASGVPGVGSSR